MTTRAVLVDLEAECAALAAADIDVVTEDGTLASKKPKYGVDTSTSTLTNTESTDDLETRILFCLRRDAARDHSER